MIQLHSCIRFLEAVRCASRSVTATKPLLSSHWHASSPQSYTRLRLLYTTGSLKQGTPSGSDDNPLASGPRRQRGRGREQEGNCPGYVISYNEETEKLVDELLLQVQDDKPLFDMPDPFEKNYRRCFLCRHDIQLDHKNVRLLSQFVSPFTGRIFGRAVTGLCIPMQKEVARLIKRSRFSGYMPFLLKDAKYLKDPQPYDPMARKLY